MSFDTVAELDLVVSDEALRNVQKQIESELGAVEIGVTDGGAMSAQAGRGGGAGASRRGRQSFQMERTRTELLEDAVVYLEEIEDKVGGGDAGGTGGILAEFLGVAGETAGDAAIEAGDTVAETLTQVLTGTAASALGNTISSAITSSEVAVEDTTLAVERPEWLDEVGGGGRTVQFNPTFDPTFEAPDLAPEINLPGLPDFNLGIPDQLAVNREPLPVQRDPLPVEAIAPLPVEDIGPIMVAVETRTGRPPASTGSKSESEPPGGVQLGGENGITVGPGGVQVGGDNGITLGRDPGDPTGVQSGSNRSSSTSPSRRDMTVTHSPTYNVDVDPRRLDSLADRIISEIEDGVERDIDALEDDLDELERDLEELNREITR